MQAALVLAIWGHDAFAVTILEQGYPKATRPLKEKILEVLASCAMESSLPFFLDRLHEPFPTLRLIAAAAILQLLYH
jgi:hypothetical protein